jgi:hypothetical protein
VLHRQQQAGSILRLSRARLAAAVAVGCACTRTRCASVRWRWLLEGDQQREDVADGAVAALQHHDGGVHK